MNERGVNGSEEKNYKGTSAPDSRHPVHDHTVPAVYGAAEHAGAAEETEVVFNRLMGDQKVDTELVGRIKVNLISVAMPSDGFDFQVYPEREFDAVNCPDGQIVGPDRLEVTTHSVVPVRLEGRSSRSGCWTVFPGWDRREPPCWCLE